MSAVARGLPTTTPEGDTARLIAQLAMQRSRSRSRARRDIIEALVETVNAQADRTAACRLHLVGAARPSGLAAQLARAQVRADTYVEILDAILPLVMTDATPEQLYRTVRAIVEKIIADYVRATVR